MLKIAKGKVTKTGVGIAALGPIVENVLNVIQGEEFQSVITAAEGTYGSVLVLVGSVVALWGSFRAAINYGGK